MIDLLGDFDVCVFAVIHFPVLRQRQVAARRVSLGSLAAAVGNEGVDELVIESRDLQDLEDRVTLINAMQTGQCPPLDYSFAGKEEPLLGLPDAAAGILSEAECRKTGRWLDELQHAVTVMDICRLDAHEPRLPS